MVHGHFPLSMYMTIAVSLSFSVSLETLLESREVITKPAVQVADCGSQMRMVTGTVERLTCSMLMLSSRDLTGKHQSTYEDFIDRGCCDESKGSEDGKQRKSELHSEQKINKLRKREEAVVLPTPLYSKMN